MNATGVQAGVKAMLRMRGYPDATVFVMWSGGKQLCSVHIRGAPKSIIVVTNNWLKRAGMTNATVKVA